MPAITPKIDTPKSSPQATSAAPSLGELFAGFLRLGATAFGGPAMVAYIRQLAVDRKGWLNARAFDDGVALCQAVPGATAMQTAAYVGLSVRGVAGAAVSFVGFGLPAFGLMLMLAGIYARTHNLPGVVSAFSGLQTIVVAMVANAAVAFGQTALHRWQHGVISAVAVALFGWGINPFLVVVLAAGLGFWLLKAEVSTASIEAIAPPMPQTRKPALLILFAAATFLTVLFFTHRRLYELATLMVRVDLFAFGGGFASVPLLFNEIVSVRHWLDSPTLSDGIVLGQVTPGPIVITATFVGYLLYGPFGAVVATLGVFLPSFLILIAAAPHFDRLRASPVFARLIGGALCSFPGLLLIVTFHFAQSVSWNPARLLLAGAAFVALRLGANIFWVVVIGAGFAMIFCR
ncbi:MAG: chromate efflux transporter [Verrucomicrobia subdivision 3 bacterium]|nr:chromate efflux transporter [Limisphaerales bacterium]